MATSYTPSSQRERNTQAFFPNSATHADQCRFVCVYPAYINGKKTRAQGRRVGKAKAIDNPTVNEIRDILENAGLTILVEPNRLYPREESREPQQRGRVRVQLKNVDGTLLKEQFKNKDDLLFYLVDMIPKLKTRTGNQQQQQQQQQQSQQSGGGKGKKR
jgi:signal recognition particle subunit SRP19